MKECNCDMRTKLVGDGCATCNPELALEYALDTIEELKQERDELAAQVDVMRDALDSAQQAMNEMRHAYSAPEWFSGGASGARRHFFNWVIKTDQEIGKALSITPSAALREIEARTLETAADWFESAPIDHAFAVRNGLREMAAAKRKGE